MQKIWVTKLSLFFLENSLDYKDSTGVDLHEFMVKTLRENPR